MTHLIALTDIRDQLEAHYSTDDPPHFTVEIVDHETFARLYNDNLPHYQGMMIMDGCRYWRYAEPDTAEIEQVTP